MSASLPTGCLTSLARRMADVLGEDFVAHSVPVQYQAGPLTIMGRTGLPSAARTRTDQQYCYVNGRFVRDKVIQHAAKAAYEDVLHGHKQPMYALYVRIDPLRVDVNVHPTKIEVRFRDSREVHQAIQHALEDALAVPRAQRLAAQAKVPDAAPQPAPASAQSTDAPVNTQPASAAMNASNTIPSSILPLSFLPTCYFSS